MLRKLNINEDRQADLTVHGGAPMLRKLNINEDRQADLTVHGGEDKAIYTYPKKDQEYRNYRSEYYEL